MLDKLSARIAQASRTTDPYCSPMDFAAAEAFFLQSMESIGFHRIPSMDSIGLVRKRLLPKLLL
jgi:hypothetical protein